MGLGEEYKDKVYFHYIILGGTCSQHDLIIGDVNIGQEVEPVFSTAKLLFLPSYTLHQQGVTESNLHSRGEELSFTSWRGGVHIYCLEFFFKQAVSSSHFQ